MASNRLLPPIPADWWWHTPLEPLTGRLGGHVGGRVATFNRCESLSWVAGGHPVGGWGVAGVSRCPPPLSRAPLDLPTYQLPLFRGGGAFVGGQGGKLNSNLTKIFSKMFYVLKLFCVHWSVFLIQLITFSFPPRKLKFNFDSLETF